MIVKLVSQITCLLCVLYFPLTYGQNLSSKSNKASPEYTQLVKEAYAFYKAKNYSKSALTYSAAIKANGGLGYMSDRYNASCSWALSGNPDSAFYQLNHVANLAGYADYYHITTDVDLNSLHADKRWQPLLLIVQKNRDKEEEKYNKPLVRQLDSIYAEDQTSRLRIDTIQKQFGFDSDEMKRLFKTINEKDSLNLIVVRNILDQYGWLGPEVVGRRGNTTLFLVIQHSDLKTQEKYLPVMREAVKNGKAEGSQLALLIDRVEMYNGRPQIYGSQVNGDRFYKIIDEVNVNKRRATVGLEPLEDYAKHFNIEYKSPKK